MNTLSGLTGKRPGDLGDHGLLRRDAARYLRGMHSDHELEVRPFREVRNRLSDPREHVRKGVRRIVQLSVPRDVRQHADHRAIAAHTETAEDVRQVFFWILHLPRNPIPAASAAAGQVVHRLPFSIGVPRQVLPVRHRLGHQRVVVRLTVTEYEGMAAVGGIPRHDPGPLGPCNLRHDSLWNVERMVQAHGVELVCCEEIAHHEGCLERRLEIPAQHHLSMRLAFDVRSGEIA